MTQPDETSSALIVREATPDPTSHASGATELELAPGQYWRLLKTRKEHHTTRRKHPAMKKGSVLLVTSIEHADGAIHSVHLAPHPTWDEHKGCHLHIEEFHKIFEPYWQADQLREIEMAAVVQAMQDTQAKMLQPPPAAKPEALLSHDPQPNAGGDARALATAEGLQSMTQHAEALRESAEAQSKWIAKHTATLGKQAGTLARFHQERGDALVARANAQLESVKKVLKLVQNLELYTGKGVGQDLLCDGTPAPIDEPITIYQDLLALDEETLAVLDQGGLDHRHIEVLGKQLQDPMLRERLIPAPRGVVLCRFRRASKNFFQAAYGAPPSEVLRAALANANENAQAKQIHLLCRDGERFWLISHESLFGGMTQLMPSTAEQNEQYIRRARWYGEKDARIAPEDLDYAEAQRAQLGRLNDYARVLIVLWGLHDRTDMFEHSAIPKFINWLDPAVQNTYLRLISTDVMLGEEREGYGAFRRRHNAYLTSGSRVAVHVQGLFGPTTAPGCHGPEYYDRYHNEHRRNEIYAYKGPRVVIDRVRLDKGKPYIEIQAMYSGYADVQREAITSKLYLSEPNHLLVIDRVHGPDLDYYLTSRKQRREYADYIELFREAREAVRARDAQEAPLRAILQQAVHEAKIPHDVDRLAHHITDAIATVRVTLRGEVNATPAVRTKILDALHAGLTQGEHQVEAAERLAASLGRQPLRLAYTGKATWRLYLSALPQDHDPRLAFHPWVMACEIAFQPEGTALGGELSTVSLRADAREQILHDWPGTENDRQALGVSWQRQQDTLARVAEFDAPIQEQQYVADRALEIAHDAFRRSKRYVDREYAAIAIGTAISYRLYVNRDEHDKKCVDEEDHEALVILVRADALDLAFHWGNAETKQRCLTLIKQYYAKPEGPQERLQHGLLKTQVLGMELADYATAGKTPVFCPDEKLTQGISGHRHPLGRPGSIKLKQVSDGKVSGYTRITTLTPTGARVAPELVEHCEAPAFGHWDSQANR